MPPIAHAHAFDSDDHDLLLELNGKHNALEQRQTTTEAAVQRIDGRMFKALFMLLAILLTTVASILIEATRPNQPLPTVLEKSHEAGQ